MSGATASELGVDLADINKEAVNIYNLIDELKKKAIFNKEKVTLNALIEAALKLLKKLQGLEVNIDVSLETLDDVILKLQEGVKGLEGDKLALEEKNARLKDQTVALEAEKATLKSKVTAMEEYVGTLEGTIEALLRYIENLKPKLDSSNQEKSKVQKDLKEILKKQREVDDSSALGDFVFQFQTLLGKYMGLKRSVAVWEISDILDDPESDLVLVERLKDIGFGDKTKVENLQRGVRYFIDTQFSTGHPAIAYKYDKSLEDLLAIAQDCGQLKFMAPIAEFWSKMLKIGKIFDSNTWEVK